MVNFNIIYNKTSIFLMSQKVDNTVPSMGGFLYYVIFVDDFSRKTWIYFLKCKELKEILKKFKDLKALTENVSRRKSKY